MKKIRITIDVKDEYYREVLRDIDLRIDRLKVEGKVIEHYIWTM